jgi:hypothetical protein
MALDVNLSVLFTCATLFEIPGLGFILVSSTVFKIAERIVFIVTANYVQPTPCGGGLGYLHRSPECSKRRQKGNQCPGS